MQHDAGRDDLEQRRRDAELRYEDALLDAQAARIGSLEFGVAMATVHAARSDLLALEDERRLKG